MMVSKPTTRSLKERPAGYILLVTLVVLVVLSMLVAGIATRLTMVKRRQQYMIEYQRARYGLDSGLKFILSEAPKLNFRYESREDKPDFSDLFWMDQEDYANMITAWAETATDEQIAASMKEDAGLYEPEPVDIDSLMGQISMLFGASENQVSGPNSPALNTYEEPAYQDPDYYIVELDPNDIEVPGPYGYSWPYVIEPIEMEVGSCKVTITIEDENAKLPLSWLVRPLEKEDLPARYALETFLEWMAADSQELAQLEQSLIKQLETIDKKKHFKLNPDNIIVKTTTSRAVKYRTVRTRDAKTGKIVTKRVAVSSAASSAASSKADKTRPAIAHTTDFAKLFHSTLLDQARLNMPQPNRGSGDGDRLETLAKYLGLWGSQRVNINTAPRHVLEAAFSMALSSSEAVEIAQEVILRRQQEPFKKTSEIKEVGLLDTDTFNKLDNYISTTSTFFKIRVTSRSGNASASATAAVVKEGRNTQTLTVLYGQ